MSANGWMFTATALLCLAAHSARAQEPLRWETDLPAACQQAAESGRLVLIHFGAPWCGPCQQLEQQVFRKPGFGQSLAADYVPVKLNVDHASDVAAAYGVTKVPADVVITPGGDLVQRLMPSPSSAQQYEATFAQLAATQQRSAPVASAPSKTPASAAGPVSGTPSTGLSDDRYAYYYQGRSGQPNSSPPVASTQPAPAQVAPSVAQSAPHRVESPYVGRGGSPTADAGPAASPSTSTVTGRMTTSGPAPSNATTEAARQPISPSASAAPAEPSVPQLPPGCPPLCLDGFCPVTLVETRQWVAGDTRWGAIHRGRTYLFVGQKEQQAFLANPDYYSPVASGNDPVLALERGETVPGVRKHGVFFGNRIYLFANEGTMSRFSTDPKRYAADLTQAMQASDRQHR